MPGLVPDVGDSAAGAKKKKKKNSLPSWNLDFIKEDSQ